MDSTTMKTDLDQWMEECTTKHYLDTFDQINLAQCAMKRAQLNFMDSERFSGEYAAARLWKNHRIIRHQINGRAIGFIN